MAPLDSLWVYNGLDCCVTVEVFQQTEPLMDEHAKLSYNERRGILAPALEIMLRGLLIDKFKVNDGIALLSHELTVLEEMLDKLGDVVWDRPLNARSPKQLKEFFYEEASDQGLCLPGIYKIDHKTKERKLTCDDNALDKLWNYFYARPFVNLIKAIREHTKLLSVLRTGISADGRMRTSINVTGTETWRFSSSEDAQGEGTNQQNITDRLRDIFIADPGRKFAVFDLEQAESRVVAYRSGDRNYIDACESGDLHTTSAQMIWPELPWNQANSLEARRGIAETPFVRHFSHRDMSKRGGHARNYLGQPPTIAKHLHIPIPVAEQFAYLYDTAFPGIPVWQQDVITRLQTDGFIITATGRKRWFLGRLWDEATWREAIAFEPQSIVGGDVTNIGLWRVWRYGEKFDIWVHQQTHDSITVSYPEHLESNVVPFILNAMRVPVRFSSRVLVIPAAAKTGWNLRTYSDGTDKKKPFVNLDGLKDWKGHDDRKRVTKPWDRSVEGFMARRLPGLYVKPTESTAVS